MYHYFGANEIKPKGWLLQQLKIQAAGLSGNLDYIWPDIKDSAWIGGSREGWERVPYWLDGFIPLAYLLEDEDMKLRADKYINAIIAGQQPDGWLCPCPQNQRQTYDIWAHFLIGKVLALYCEFSGSKSAQNCLYQSMQCLNQLLTEKSISLFDWGKFRWFECLIPLQFLYDIYKEDWIKELAVKLRDQGADYPSLKAHWQRPLNKWTFHTHIVNLAMMLKYEVLCHELLGESYEDQAEKLWQELEKYNGTAVGTFTGDECLSGLANNQGTELCSIVELMYTCELLYAITQNPVWAERLERIAFNALPASLSDDMWTHQYDQMVNQIACVRFPGKSFFRTNNEEAHLFGLEPNFGCCTANFNQGWPKFTMSAFLQTKEGILCSMLPSELTTKIKDIKVKITTESSYPFRLGCQYIIQTDAPVSFEFKIRIPHWAKSVLINGKQITHSGFYTIQKQWCGTEVITVSLKDAPHLVQQASGLWTAEYGPMVFSLPIQTRYRKLEYEKDGVKRIFPYCDYELIPESEWRYGFDSNSFIVCEHEGDSVPFSSLRPSITLKARLCPVNWNYADGYDSVSAKLPVSETPTDTPIEKELFPYGCAKLRMTEMPFMKK